MALPDMTTGRPPPLWFPKETACVYDAGARRLSGTPAPRMPSSFQSISAQVADTLRQELQSGTWTNQLPGERRLSERLGVSRKTLRKALAMLRAEGMLQTRGNRTSPLVQVKGAATGRQVKRVALLIPEPMEQARPFTVLWVNHLMGLLHNADMSLEIVAGWKYFGSRATHSLQKLLSQHPARCWLLARSHRPMQQWFAGCGARALVAGSTHEGVDLPSVDIDHHALCRHAALTFIRQGHRKLALFLEKAGHGGDIDSERGFIDGVRQQEDAAPPLICRPGKGTAAIIRELKRVQTMHSPPTGYLLSNSLSYLTVQSYLASQGLRVPQDVSLISRDEEPFLTYLHPEPTRYAIAPVKFAMSLFQAIKRVVGHGVLKRFDIRIMPDFIKGGSIAPK